VGFIIEPAAIYTRCRWLYCRI